MAKRKEIKVRLTEADWEALSQQAGARDIPPAILARYHLLVGMERELQRIKHLDPIGHEVLMHQISEDSDRG